MCGIIGYTGRLEAAQIILEGLRRLEYRGYDSAGIALQCDSHIEVRRCKGKIRDLEALMRDFRLPATTAIGHTRWATHGRPSEENAHPHRSGDIVLVHNGIIENHLELKASLEADGFRFASETDTEVVSHLVNKHAHGRHLQDAVRRALSEVRGSYAVAVMSMAEPGIVVAARKDSPLVVGVDDDGAFVASDIPAFLAYSRHVAFLEDEEMATLTPAGVTFEAIDGRRLQKEFSTVTWDASMAEKGGYRHFMLKEIYEQPRAIADTITGRFHPENDEVNILEFGMDEETLAGLEKVFIVACGTSWHAAVTGKYMIEELARVPVEVDIASEFRYRDPLMGTSTLFISITQSGETADTLAAQRLAQQTGVRTLNICNVIGSSSSREAYGVFYTRSGPEIGVASTKAFTTQMTALVLFALSLARAKNAFPADRAGLLLHDLMSIPDKVEQTLRLEAQVEEVARELHKTRAMLYLGRGINHAIAMEGALKLKEISYIHAEAYPAGEMKHGPIALVEEGYPVLFLAPRDRLFEKVLSNIQEIRSRGGRIIIVTDRAGKDTDELADHTLVVPEAHHLLLPILFSVPLQLLAYHIGVQRGCDVDQPRNLAKSVTVE